MDNTHVHWQSPPDMEKILRTLYEIAYPDYDFTVKLTPKKKAPEREAG